MRRRFKSGLTVIFANAARFAFTQGGADAIGQSTKLHLFEEVKKHIYIRVSHSRIFERNLNINICFQCNEFEREPRIINIGHHLFTATLLRDFITALEQCFQIPKMLKQNNSRLNPNPRNTWNIINGVSSEGLNFYDLLRPHAKFLNHLRNADLLVFHGVEHGNFI